MWKHQSWKLIISKACWEAVISFEGHGHEKEDASLIACHKYEEMGAYVHIYTYTSIYTPQHIIGKGLMCYLWLLCSHPNK